MPKLIFPAACFRPAYFGDDWLGIGLDLGDTEWDAIGEWCARGWRMVAPKRLTALMAAEGFRLPRSAHCA